MSNKLRPLWGGWQNALPPEAVRKTSQVRSHRTETTNHRERIATMSADRSQSPSRRMTRRQLLRAGSAGLFGLTLERLLAAGDLQAASGLRPATAKSCILIILSGGLSHLDTLDPKPDAPVEIRGPYRPIATAVAGTHLSEMLPQLARLAHRYSLVRSFSHGDTVHVTAVQAMLTGQHDGGRQNQMPFVGSLIAKLQPAQRAVPSYVWLHNMKTGTNKVPRYESGLHLIGREHAPLRVGHELDNPAAPDFRVTAFDPAEGLTAQQITERFRLLQRLEGQPGAVADGGPGQQFQSYRERALNLLTGPDARQAFELQHEPERVRDRYGRHPLGQYLLMARRLIEAGVRLVTVTAWPGLAPGETTPTITQVWDMHDDRYRPRDSMYGNGPFGMQWSLPRLDQGVSALLEDLDARGLLAETLVALVSEFGRTPRFEGQGRGRGHWPHCYSGLLAGGGIRPGAVYGSSDRQGAQVATGRPIAHPDFAATLFHALGIPPETRYGPDDFSFRVSSGEPVLELFA
jgi:hypothetical protein